MTDVCVAGTSKNNNRKWWWTKLANGVCDAKSPANAVLVLGCRKLNLFRMFRSKLKWISILNWTRLNLKLSRLKWLQLKFGKIAWIVSVISGTKCCTRLGEQRTSVLAVRCQHPPASGRLLGHRWAAAASDYSKNRSRWFLFTRLTAPKICQSFHQLIDLFLFRMLRC